MDNESAKTLHPVSVSEKQAAVFTTDEVFRTIAATAALEAEGVAALADHGTGEAIARGNLRGPSRSVRLVFGQQQVSITVSLILGAGATLKEACGAVQDRIFTAIHDMVGYRVLSVNILVADVLIH